MKGLLFVIAFLGLALTARYLHVNSDAYAANKAQALAALRGVPGLTGVDVPSESCSYISKNSITSLDCKFNTFASVDETTSEWKQLLEVEGQDPWRRTVTKRSFRRGNWVAVLYLSGGNQLVGASLALSPEPKR